MQIKYIYKTFFFFFNKIKFLFVCLTFTIKAEILLHFFLLAASALLGEIKLPGIELSLPALPGLEYPDPGGSGLNVPVLGAQLDWVSGCMVPVAGTMEDADGKGNVGY